MSQNFCYGLKICVLCPALLKFICWNPIPNVGPLKVMRSQGWSPHDGMGVFIKEAQGAPLPFHHVRTQREGAIYKPSSIPGSSLRNSMSLAETSSPSFLLKHSWSQACSWPHAMLCMAGIFCVCSLNWRRHWASWEEGGTHLHIFSAPSGALSTQ